MSLNGTRESYVIAWPSGSRSLILCLLGVVVTGARGTLYISLELAPGRT